MNSALTFDFAPLVPWPLLLVCAAVALMLTCLGLWRHARGTLLRAAVALLAIATLANPVARREDRSTLPDIAVVVVDESPSQGIADRQRQAEQAEAALREKLGAIENLEVRVVKAGKAAAETADRDEGTRLFSGLTLALSDLPRHRVAGSILVTDGQVHDMPAEIAAAQDVTGAPVHVLLTGRPDERDRRLVVRNAPTFGMINQDINVVLRVDDTGAAPNETAELRFRQQDAGERVLQVPVGRDVTVPFKLPRAGRSLLEFEVAPIQNELTPLNNRVALSVNGVRDRLRVLLVTGEAHAGERVWRNLLKADPNVDLVHFTILRPPDKQDGTPIRELSLIAFPIRELFELKLNEFDLIIFDRYRRRGILPTAYYENIARYVERGGAFLEVSGPAYATPLSIYRTPVSEVLPGRPHGTMRTEPFTPQLSAIGKRHPVTAGLPGSVGENGQPTWSRWFRVVNVDVTRGNSVMESPNREPLLVLDRVEKGRVAQFYSDHIWLWSRGYEGGGPQSELLRRLAHWLMKEPDLEEEALRAEAKGGRLEVERRSLTERKEPVTVIRPDGSETRLTLEDQGNGIASGRLPVELPGIYRVRDGERETVATMGAINPKEFSDPRATPAVLKPLADASHGSVRWLQDGTPDIRMVDKPTRSAVREQAGRNWIGLYRQNDYVVTGLTLTPLVLPLAMLTALLLGMLLMWRRESR
ncbi:hypothetical protein [Ferrovibrio sp.]|uniref:hypothetical protein n=1 Tax=Ferrovibrio sp. TaxID=1917215 RepID=UPI000CBBC37F|nr:hypothetical protein [Ferrovibrio sp.]PJI39239.1 MAG: hypothetical protein CTR53_15205 [Ferrovibrio sp.]